MPATPPTSKGHPSDDVNGWPEYRRLVLSELERINLDVSRAIQQGSNIQLSLSQSIADVRSALLDKIRETSQNLDNEYDKKFDSIKYTIDLHGKEIAAIKAKATVLGAAAGFVVALGGLLVSIFIKK